jgi:purine-binding chemotaxis protein CheW
MANNKAKKPLFQDPFMDMAEPSESGQKETREEVVAKDAVELGAKKRGATTDKVEPAIKRKTAGKAEAKSGIKKRTASKAKTKPKAEKKATAEAKPKAGSKKKAKTRAAAKPRVVKKEDDDAKSKSKTRKRTKAKTKAKPELEDGATAGVRIQPEVVKDVVAESQFIPDIEPIKMVEEPEEGVSLLETLIAAIDEEVEEAFGPGAMTDLVPTKQAGQAGEEQHVIFELAGTEYAAHIDNVTEIGEPLDATLVPNVPSWVLGVANLRGDIISVVDMRTFLGVEAAGYGQENRMVVAQARDEELTTGLIVDRVSGIRHLDMGQISEPTAPIDDQVAPYLRGVYEHDGHVLVVLDFDKLLLSPEMSKL